MPLADLQSTITPNKLRYIGLVSAHQIEALLVQHKVPEIKRRAVLNQLHNMRHTTNAEEWAVADFANSEVIGDGPEPAPYVEINIPSKGVTGPIGPIIYQKELDKYLVVVGTDSYLLEGSQNIRLWKDPEAYRSSSSEWRPSEKLMAAAHDAVGKFSEALDEAERQSSFTKTKRDEAIDAAEKTPGPQFIQMNFNNEPLNATEIYRQARNLIDTNSRAGAAHISSEHTVEWVLENQDELLGRTMEIRRSHAIHPANGSFVKGVFTGGWKTNQWDAMLTINGTDWADNLGGSVLLYEPQYCNHLVDADRARRCSKLNKHDGEHA